MPPTLWVPGVPESASSASSRGSGDEPVSNLFADIEVVAAYSLSPTSRARGAAAPKPLACQESDVLEVEVDGFTLWTSPERYDATIRALRRPERHGEPVVVDSLPGSDIETRGEQDRSATAVRLLRVVGSQLEDLLQQPDTRAAFAADFGVTLAGKTGSWVFAKALIWLIERQLALAEGLYAWTDATRAGVSGVNAPAPAAFSDGAAGQRIVVFIHGTASSTRGSFGAFLTEAASDQWREIEREFGTQIYAFEHRTLSRSPIENAIMLAERLPARAKLTLVTHSRGGLIGDLLCLGSIPSEDIAAFGRHGQADDADAHDRQGLQRLAELLEQKQFDVQRFARVASPARGTLLASENLDQFLSLIAFLVGQIPALKLSLFYDIIKRVTLETVRRRWEPAMVPGIEAMTPSSPIVRLINTSRRVSGELGVIAGDLHGGSWLRRFGVFVSDRMLYDNRDNDLIVNTDSMFQGGVRAAALYVFDRGADVSHFHYFRNQRTRSSVSRWITAASTSSLAEFRRIEEITHAPVAMPRSGNSRPIVVIVPDIMGSALGDTAGLIWPNVEALSAGRLEALSDPQVAAARVELLGGHYNALCQFLANTHDVVPFPYDWRQSLAVNARALRRELERLLGETHRPIRILAHGAGGLIVRHLMTGSDVHDAPDTWQRIIERDGSRVIMLGTPHKGTLDAVELLIGTHPVAQQLALLDAERGIAGVVALLQSFPGVLELLPEGKDRDYFLKEAWTSFDRPRAGARAPDQAQLTAAKRARERLGEIASGGGNQICNVAGLATRTVASVEATANGDVVLTVTGNGDGRVLLDSVELTTVKTLFLAQEHGALVSENTGFGALDELLQNGTSDRAATRMPIAPGVTSSVRRTLAERVLYPTGDDLLSAALGGLPRETYRDVKPLGFRVSVVHGDLTFARFPIMVGHYEADTIIGAEAVIDDLFNGALRMRYNLGLYPGALGTISVVVRQPTPFQRALNLAGGAIVMGLGRWGELTTGQIANIVRRGALEYVLQTDIDSAGLRKGRAPASGQNIGLSILLIGATASNISTEDSVAAIMRGIAQANLELDRFVEQSTTRIGEIEIIELYVDTAIAAARAVVRLADVLGEELDLRIDAEAMLRRGRHGRVRFGAGRNQDAWRRWEITAERGGSSRPRIPDGLRTSLAALSARKNADPDVLQALASLALTDQQDMPPSRLRFVTLSDRARAEVVDEQHQPLLIDRLIQSSITNTRYDANAARALFELMMPNDLKDGLGQLSNVVFVLDADTSAYPWELMTDGGDQPLCTRVRLVRQLQSSRFRPHIRVTTAKTAYVVGDPLVPPPYKQLVGARDEARVVAERLKEGGFTPTRLDPEAPALDVLAGLVAQPYRIVHLCGHGEFHHGGTASSAGRGGMVLDGGVFLTAAEIRKMPQVPELVFLNCCSIGQIGPEPVTTARHVSYNILAASISRELIDMGVRAVVAAGWAVRDDAALLFARTFYDEMLRGETFGRALFTARASTWRVYPSANTFGAYQAYGDPDFRLALASSASPPIERVAHEELLEQIDKVWRRARKREQEQEFDDAATQEVTDRKARENDQQVAELVSLLKDAPPSWLQRSDVCVAIAEAYGELARFDESISYFQRALDTGELDNKTTVRAVEQLLNFSSRDAADKKNAEKQRSAIERLHAMQIVNPTAERYSLLGGAHKRLAMIVAPSMAKESLVAAARAYRDAHELNVASGAFRHYPVVNWLALEVVLGNRPAQFEALLQQAEVNARDCLIKDGWAKDAPFDAVAPADIAVVRALASGMLDRVSPERGAEIDRISRLYADGFARTQGTRRQRDSAASQLCSLAMILDLLSGTTDTPSSLAQEALREIQSRF